MLEQTKIDGLIQSATAATVIPAKMFFSTRHTLPSEVATIAQTAINAFLMNLTASGVVLKINPNVDSADPNYMESIAETLRPEQPKPLPDSPTDETIARPGAFLGCEEVKIHNPVVSHEDNELTGERVYIYEDGTRSAPQPAPASLRPNGQATD